MAALEGFDLITGTATVTTPFAAGATLLSVSVPARTVVAALDLTATDLDSNASPAITLNVGDAADVDRYVAASTVARAGGTVENRPASSAWWRYTAADAVTVRVGTDAATDAAGTVSMTLYTYPGADLSDVVKATLQRLGVLGESETPRAGDDQITREALAEVHEMMRGRLLTTKQDLTWPLELIPMFALRAYAGMAANLLADAFQIPASRVPILAQRAAQGEMELRRMTRKPYSGEPVSLDPYGEFNFSTDYGVTT